MEHALSLETRVVEPGGAASTATSYGWPPRSVPHGQDAAARPDRASMPLTKIRRQLPAENDPAGAPDCCRRWSRAVGAATPRTAGERGDPGATATGAAVRQGEHGLRDDEVALGARAPAERKTQFTTVSEAELRAPRPQPATPTSRWQSALDRRRAFCWSRRWRSWAAWWSMRRGPARPISSTRDQGRPPERGRRGAGRQSRRSSSSFWQATPPTRGPPNARLPGRAGAVSAASVQFELRASGRAGAWRICCRSSGPIWRPCNLPPAIPSRRWPGFRRLSRSLAGRRMPALIQLQQATSKQCLELARQQIDEAASDRRAAQDRENAWPFAGNSTGPSKLAAKDRAAAEQDLAGDHHALRRQGLGQRPGRSRRRPTWPRKTERTADFAEARTAKKRPSQIASVSSA